MPRARKETTQHPDIGSGRVGLAVVDMQTVHRGHVSLLNEMRMTCDHSIVAIGSVRKHGTEGHPFTFEQRKSMIEGVFGDAFRFLPLDDIDARNDRRAWYAYVSEKIAATGLPAPTDYFGGSRIDAAWYVHAFANFDTHETGGAKVVTHVNHETKRRLHIVDRNVAGIPSGREVRFLIEMRDPEWKSYVPEVLHRFVERHYPPHLRQPVRIEEVLAELSIDYRRANELGFGFDLVSEFPVAIEKVMGLANRQYPVGTRVAMGSYSRDKVVFEFKDDGRWRIMSTVDEKAAWSRNRRDRQTTDTEN